MKHFAVATLVLASPLLAQQTGVSHPSDAPIDDDSTPVSVATPATPKPSPYVSVQAVHAADADHSEDSPAITLKQHERSAFKADPDAGIVTADPPRSGVLPSGTLIRVRMTTPIQTANTQAGSSFEGVIATPVQNLGQVAIPEGSVVKGRVTQIRGGKRIRGAAMIHLQPQSVELPDGRTLPIVASVVDAIGAGHNKTDAEGNILQKGNPAQTLGVVSLAAGSGAAAGALVGGGVGAVVGAGVGAGISTVMWLKQDRQMSLDTDSVIVLALEEPLSLLPAVSRDDLSRSSQAPATAAQASTIASPQAFVPTN